jgi:hypothetical protein
MDKTESHLVGNENFDMWPVAGQLDVITMEGAVA